MAVRRGHRQRHPDLIHGEERGVGGEFTDGPGQFEKVRDHVRQRGNEGKQGIFARNTINNAVRNGAAEDRKRAGEREFELSVL